MVRIVQISDNELERIKAGDRTTTLKWYNVLRWTLGGYVPLNAPGAPMDSPPDMARAIVRAVEAGISLMEIPHHPQDYITTIGELVNTLPEKLREEAMEQLEASVLPEHLDDHLKEEALWGCGWFGGVVPGYFGTISGPTLRGVGRNMLEVYRGRGHADACFAEPMPEGDGVHVIAPREDYLWGLEEKAAEGDFLSHLAIRALFLGVGKAMSNVGDVDLMYIATTHPIPNLTAHIRVWRHRDGRSYARMGQGLGMPTASEEAFAREGFLEECLERGKVVAREQGGFKLPELIDTPSLQLMAGDVEVNMMFPHLLGMKAEVVDIVGMDAAQGAMAQVAETLGTYGISVHPVQF